MEDTVVIGNTEWMTTNLSGHGGVQKGDNWYYNQDKARQAAYELGNGWRLPSRADVESLVQGGWSWDEANHLMQFRNGFTLLACGYLDMWSDVRVHPTKGGLYRLGVTDGIQSLYLAFSTFGCWPQYVLNKDLGSSVRLCRTLK